MQVANLNLHEERTSEKVFYHLLWGQSGVARRGDIGEIKETKFMALPVLETRGTEHRAGSAPWEAPPPRVVRREKSSEGMLRPWPSLGVPWGRMNSL